jgi:predicted MFS family arabinose efflux permease
VLQLLPDDRPAETRRGLDLPGAVLATGAMLLLVYTLVEAPDTGWGSARTIAGLTGAAVLLAGFVATERRTAHPLVPSSILRVPGLVAANAIQFTAFAGFLSMFFFLTLFMENVLGYSPIRTGIAYLPICIGVGVSAGIGSQLIARIGSRPIVVVGSLVTAAGVFWLSRISAEASYLTNVLPGMVILSLGIGAVFVTVTAAANAGVPPEQAGLAAALLNSSQQVGGALGLAVLSAIATARTNHLLSSGVHQSAALTSGFGRGLFVGAVFLVVAATLGLRTTNTHEAEA